MKYMQNGGFQNHPLMRLTLAWTVVFLVFFWISNFFFFFSKMALTPSSIVDYYRGSEALFTQPRSLQSMIEVTHGHLPVMAIVLLMLTHLLIFAPLAHRTKVLFISLAFGGAFFNEAASWLVRYVHPGFAWLKIVAFVTLQTLIGYLLLALARFLWRAAQEKPPQPRHRGRRAVDDL
jgi:hypothetical protein